MTDEEREEGHEHEGTEEHIEDLEAPAEKQHDVVGGAVAPCLTTKNPLTGKEMVAEAPSTEVACRA